MFSVSQTMQYMNEKDSSCCCYIINKQIKSDTNMFPLSILMPKDLLFCCTFLDQILASKLVICMKTLCKWAMLTMLHRSAGFFRVLFLLFSSFFRHKKRMTSVIITVCYLCPSPSPSSSSSICQLCQLSTSYWPRDIWDGLA